MAVTTKPIPLFMAILVLVPGADGRARENGEWREALTRPVTMAALDCAEPLAKPARR